MLPEDSPIFGLIRQVREGGYSVSEYGVTIASPKIGTHFVSIDAAALSDRPGSVVVSVHELSIARKIDHQLVHRNAARSVTARSEEHTSELQSLMRISYAVFCLQKNNNSMQNHTTKTRTRT